MRVGCSSTMSFLANLIKKWCWPAGCANSLPRQQFKKSAQRMCEIAARWQSVSHICLINRMYGHTLLELLIALPLGLCVTLAGVSLYRAQRASFEQIVERSQLAEAGWTALHLIATHLRMAGFSSPLNGQHNVADFLGLFGCTASRPTKEVAKPRRCKAERGGHSDGIEIRYQADAVSTWKSRDGKSTDCLGQAIEASKNTGEQAMVPVINRFFARLSPSTGKPELYCEGNGGPGIAQPVVEGVERLYLRYQLGNAASGLNLVDASAIAADQWNKVSMVQLCVVMRGTRYATDATYLDCDGRRVASADGLPRQALTTWVALRNSLNFRSPDGFTGAE